MRILHCADIHLDSKLNANFDSEISKKRRAEIVLSFKKLIQFAADKGVDAVIIAGDLFDTGTITKTTVGIVRGCIVSNPDIIFYYLKGNHDAKNILDEITDLDNLKFFGENWTQFTQGNVTITGVSEADDYKKIYDNLRLDENSINIVTMHGQIYENLTEDGICLSALRHRGIDYLALGHIHSHSMDKLDERGVYCYPGCLESRGFDECGEHGVVLIDTEDNSLKYEFVPWGERKAYRIDTDISKCMDTADCLEAIKDSFLKNGITSCDMTEVVLTGQIDAEAEYSLDILTQELNDKYFCVKIKDKTKIYINYENYANDISLKGEFIRLVIGDKKLDEDTRAEIIRTGLMALSGENV